MITKVFRCIFRLDATSSASDMKADSDERIAAILLKNLPRDTCMAVREALTAGAARAMRKAAATAEGHRSSVLGQLRHFEMNESFHSALEAANAKPTALVGNRIVTGRAGLVRLARFNIASGLWVNARRSATRLQLARANVAIEQLVQPELFAEPPPVHEAVVFFAAIFSGSIHHSPEGPLAIEIAVPNRDMTSWIFREPVERFVERFDFGTATDDAPQPDNARPRLRRIVDRDTGTTEGEP